MVTMWTHSEDLQNKSTKFDRVDGTYIYGKKNTLVILLYQSYSFDLYFHEQ